MIPDVLGPAEAAATIGVSRQRMNVLARKPEFPRPVELESGRVWDGPTMRAYALDRTNRTLKHQRCLLEYRRTGSIKASARYAPCDYKTAKAWLLATGALAQRDDITKP